jgi:hypothetical protein
MRSPHHAGRPADLTTLTAWGPHGVDVTGVIGAHVESVGFEEVRNTLLGAAYGRAWGTSTSSTAAQQVIRAESPVLGATPAGSAGRHRAW